jgi:type IV pilus assembly protein PilB
MAQRLVRIICPKCRRQTTVDDGLLELSGLDPAQYQNQAWYEGVGCDYCHGTGYRGRAAVTEFLALSPSIRQMIIERRPINEMQAAAVQNGMVTLRQSALALVFSGQATLKEINRVTFVE